MGIIDLFPFFFVVAGLLSPGTQPMTSDLPSTGTPQATGTPQESLVGSWEGMLIVPGGEIPTVFHFQAAEGGGYTATIDSPTQGAMGIPVSEVTFVEGHLKLVSSAAKAEFEGDLSAEGTVLSGVWRQGGGEFELTLVKEGSLPPVEPSEAQKPIVGSWLGTLEIPGGGQLRMVFNIDPAADGGFAATVDSPDQGVSGIPFSEATFADGHLRLFSSDMAATFEGDLSPDGTILEGNWIQGGMELTLSLERTEGPVAPPPRPQEPERPFPYDDEEVRFTNPAGGHTLAGTVTLPRGGAPHPAVVLVSGSGAQDRNETVAGHRPFLVLSDHLTRHGIAVLRFDDRGTGESEGDHASADSEGFASDVLAGVAYLKGRDDIDAGKIGVVGHSEGGLIAPMTAVRSSDVAFIVMMAGPGVSGEEILFEQGAVIARAGGATEESIESNRLLQEALFKIVGDEPDPEVALPLLVEVMKAHLAQMTEEDRTTAGLTGNNEDQLVRTQVEMVNSPWFRFFLTFDPGSVLRRVSVPVLAINGELDLQVPPYQNLPVIERALIEGGNPDVTIVELPGLNHLFQTCTTGSPSEYQSIEETFSPMALETISAWILERVGTGSR